MGSEVYAKRVQRLVPCASELGNLVKQTLDFVVLAFLLIPEF